MVVLEGGAVSYLGAVGKAAACVLLEHLGAQQNVLHFERPPQRVDPLLGRGREGRRE